MSPQLKQFLSDWLAWAEGGAPEGEPFNRAFGLCRSSRHYGVTEELTALFRAQGLNDAIPFGPDYWDRSWPGTQHLCPKRLAWVRKQLAREALAPSLGEFYFALVVFALFLAAVGASL